MSYGVLGGGRRGGVNVQPAWMIAAARREFGAAIPEAGVVNVGRVSLGGIEGLNELADARQALFAPDLGAVARTATEIADFTAAQQLPQMPLTGEAL